MIEWWGLKGAVEGEVQKGGKMLLLVVTGYTITRSLLSTPSPEDGLIIS